MTWTVKKKPAHGCCFSHAIYDGEEPIADVYGADTAALIAAAPELLEALLRAESLLQRLEGLAVVSKDPAVLPTLDAIGAAIAKAEGK